MVTGTAIKHLYAQSVHGARRALERRGASFSAPPPQKRWRHWAVSLTAIHDPGAMVGLGVPWWTYSAIAEVEAWLLRRRHPVRVFEYGSGASTVWLSRRADEVFSVEHDAGFAQCMAPALTNYDNASVRTVRAEPMPHPVVPSAKPGHVGLDFAAYVGAIDDVPGTFDLIVIDGRARTACLEASVGRLADDGLIVFDNSRRRRYRAAISRSGLDERIFRGLTPSLPYPEQTSLLVRS
jgi:predicted O-methyltransferase YrrM